MTSSLLATFVDPLSAGHKPKKILLFEIPSDVKKEMCNKKMCLHFVCLLVLKLYCLTKRVKNTFNVYFTNN